MAGECVFIDFVNQDKYVSINDLLEMDQWELHYQITT